MFFVIHLKRHNDQIKKKWYIWKCKKTLTNVFDLSVCLVVTLQLVNKRFAYY